MVFSSLTFICVFLPVVFLLTLAVPGMRAKNLLLALFSLVFYAYGEPVYVLLMLVSTIANWIFGRLVGPEGPSGPSVLSEGPSVPPSIPPAGPSVPPAGGGPEKTAVHRTQPAAAGQVSMTNAAATTGAAAADTASNPETEMGMMSEQPAAGKQRAAGGSGRRKAWLAAAVVMNLGFLVFFKYAGMLTQILTALTGLAIAAPEISLPIGISFYTFQAMSYVIDVWRGEVEGQKSYLHVLLYISFFPQLIAGPIVRYKDIEKQLVKRKITLTGASEGFRRFCFGLSKKVLLSNTMGVVADAIFEASQSEINAVCAWIGAIAYVIQIYFDFSGYSDMAIGLAKMFGFTYRENFLYPYASTSIKEFWRRWHISLSSWLKEYLYIPLGGNRKGRPRAVLNKLFVFFCCGLWHGAAWTFVVWGLIHGLFLLLEEYIPIRRLPKVLGWLYTMLVVTLAFVVFRSDGLDQAGFMISRMLTGFWVTKASVALALEQMTPLVLVTFAAAVIAAAPIKPMLEKHLLGEPVTGSRKDEPAVLTGGILPERTDTAGATQEAAREVTRETGAKATLETAPEAAPETEQKASRELARGNRSSGDLAPVWDALSYLLALGLFCFSFLSLASGGYNPFIYFRF